MIIEQWKNGYDMYINHPLKHEIDIVVNNIKKRLLCCKSTNDLGTKYDNDNKWCLDLAKALRPERPFCWNLSIVEDAAYYMRYLEVNK